MVVFVSNDVKKELQKYKNALRRYPISRERAIEKYNNMVDALLSLGNNQAQCRPCMYKDLGQKFDSMGNPMFKNLFRYDYKDESKFPWAFAVVIDKIRNTVTITKMMASSSIKESKDRILQAILEFHKRLMAIR